MALLLSGCGQGAPRSIILFVASGMGIGQVSADYYFNADSPFSDFSVATLVATDPRGEEWISDAAAAASALATGEWLPRGSLSMTPDGQKLRTVLEAAQKKHKRTGLVATSSLTYPTAAAFAAHAVAWGKEYRIATQMAAADVDVLLGGGRRFFQYNTTLDSNLLGAMAIQGYEVISQQLQLELIDTEKIDKLIGLFAEEALRKAQMRTLSMRLMTQQAVKVLDNGERGFFLVVEGSQIDWRCHERDSDGFLAEMRDFSAAVQWALQYQREHPDLLVIALGPHETGGLFLVEDLTADHETRIQFLSRHHTANFCPLFAHGPGAEKFCGLHPLHQIGKLLMKLVTG